MPCNNVSWRNSLLNLWILFQVVASAFSPSNLNSAAFHSRLFATTSMGPCPGLNFTNATSDLMRPLDKNITITCNEFSINVNLSVAASEKSKYLVVDVLSSDYTTSYARVFCQISPGQSGAATIASPLDQLIPSYVQDLIVDTWLTDQAIFDINAAIAWRSMTVPQVQIPALVETCTVPCPRVPCGNGGVCVNESCVCPKFYSGNMCEDYAPQASVGLGACGSLPEGASQDVTNPLATRANFSCNEYTFPVQVAASNVSRVNYVVMDILSNDYSKWFGGTRCVLYPGQFGDISLGGEVYIPSGTTGINVNIWQVDASIYDADSSNAWQFALGGQKQLTGFLLPCATRCPDTPCQNGGVCNGTKCICTKCWTGTFCTTPAPGDPTFVYGLGDPCSGSRQDSQSMFIVLLSLYSALCFVSGVQVMRLRGPICRPDDSNSKQTSYTLVFQHGTITGIGLMRALSFVSLGGIKRFSLFGTAFLTVIPYMMNFWIYSLLVLQWSSLVEQDFSFSNRSRHQEGRSFRGVKCLFIIANFVVALAVLVYFFGVGFQFQPILLSEIASIILCVVYSVTGISFLFYGAALQQELGTIRQRSERTGGESTCGIQTRIKLGALSVSLSFLVESFIFASSINGNTSKLDAILSFFELWALTTILALYFQGVNSAVGNKNQKKASRSFHGGTRTEFSKTTQKGSAKNLDSPKNKDREVELEHAYQIPPTPPGEIQPNKEEVPLSSTIDISGHYNVIQAEPSPRSYNGEGADGGGMNVGGAPSPRSSTEEVGSSTDTTPSSPSLKAVVVQENNTVTNNGNVDADFSVV